MQVRGSDTSFESCEEGSELNLPLFGALGQGQGQGQVWVRVQGQALCLSIVNKAEWLGSPADIKGANRNAKIQVGRSTTVQNLLLCAHTQCMSYATNTFLLVRSSVQSKQLLCFVRGQGQKENQNIEQRNLWSFFNYSPLLTMVQPRRKICLVVLPAMAMVLYSGNCHKIQAVCDHSKAIDQNFSSMIPRL